MAQRSSFPPAPVGTVAHGVEVLQDGIAAVSRERTLAGAMLAAVDAVAAASGAAVARGLLHRATGDLEVGPVGGSMDQRRLLDHFLAGGDPVAPATGVINGVHRVVQAPVEVDGIEVGRLDVFLFEPSDGGLDPVISSLADALALVARSEGADGRVQDQLRMIGNLAHELRTPLTTLIGYIDVLTRSWRDVDDDERDRILTVLDRQARRMTRLSQEASTIAKTGDVGLQDLRFDRVDLTAAVEIALTDLLHDHEIRVRCGEGIWVKADPDRLQQMLLNLLGNALAHGQPPI